MITCDMMRDNNYCASFCLQVQNKMCTFALQNPQNCTAMAEKTRYTDEELEEFRTLINEKLEVAKAEYEHLRQMDRKRYKSYSAATVAAINDHFSRQARLADNPFLETRERQDAFIA